MAGTSLLALLDDIASVLDDVALMTKMAAKKTAGVLGDDLALNAEQVSGVRAERELPVVWKVAKGSFRNKLILVPAAIAISALVPWLITPLLMLGGAYLCFEGAEKLVAELEAKGLEVIYDDRKKVSPGVKFKDAELIGVPLVAVVGRDYVNDGTIELRDRNGENKVAVPAAEAADALAERFAALS